LLDENFNVKKTDKNNQQIYQALIIVSYFIY